MIYSSLLLAVLVLGSPYWLSRMVTSGRYRAGLSGRLGWVPEELKTAVAGRDLIWVHAVSVGEVLAAVPLIRELKLVLPSCLVAVSTTTETGQRLAKERLPESPVFYLPLDFRSAVRRYLRVLRPKMLVLMESELWPRLIDECEKSGVPVAVANARISDRSFPRYMRLRALWRPFLERISLFLAQSDEAAARLVKIGAPLERVRVMGNLKYDVRVGNQSPMTKMLREQLPARSKVLVCGSTLEGEERMLLKAWIAVLAAEPNAVMVLAPRHPDRFAVVAGLISENGFASMRASEFLKRPEAVIAGTVFLLDTIGDLASIYGIAAVAFVGGSLVAKGGHNPLEPAQFAVPVVMGTSFENFRGVVEAMQKEDAIRIVTPKTLEATLIALLRDQDAAKELGERGRATFEAQSGATAGTARALTKLLQKSPVTER